MNFRYLSALLPFFVMIGCGDPETRECSSSTELSVCEDGDCRSEPCRGDQTCQAGSCEPWFEALGTLDFSARLDDARADRVWVEVLEGSFPERWAETVRFDFGDGTAGYGMRSTHVYDQPGVYAVVLEVRLAGFRTLRASRSVLVGEGPVESRIQLTVNEIPELLNGSRDLLSDAGTPTDGSDDFQESFHLLVPRAGFTVDVIGLSSPDDPLDLSALVLTASRDLGGLTAGSDLSSFLMRKDESLDQVPRMQWVVDSEHELPSGLTLLRLEVPTVSTTLVAEIEIEAMALAPEQHPFDRPMTWLFDFEKDFFSIGGGSTGEGTELLVAVGGNGLADFWEEMEILGAQSSTPTSAAVTVKSGDDVGSNAIYGRWVKDALRTEVYRVFGIGPDGRAHDGIDFDILYSGDAGSPAASDFAVSGNFSMMRFGGAFDGFLGFSLFAPHNQERVDDTTADLGVGTAGILGPILATPGIQEEFWPIHTEQGVPVGEHPLDALVLETNFDPWATDVPLEMFQRWNDLQRIARMLGRAIASVTAHEMGHAMGLMPNGAPPLGFFGDRVDVSFMGDATNSHHADLPGLNLMQTGGNLLVVLAGALENIEVSPSASIVDLAIIFSEEMRLSPYSRAYLQGRLTYSGD